MSILINLGANKLLFIFVKTLLVMVFTILHNFVSRKKIINSPLSSGQMQMEKKIPHAATEREIWEQGFIHKIPQQMSTVLEYGNADIKELV